MRNLFLIPVIIFLTSCATQRNFPEKEVCFLLYDLKNEKFEEIYNEKRCHTRYPAASTFKVALSVMAFDSGVLKDESTPVFKWNKVPTPLEAWNKDQTPTTWIRESVVWMSQEITPKIGMDKIEKYLTDFEYGNMDMTAGLKYAWLTPAPFIKEPMQNSLKISAFEEVQFLRKLWRGELKASPESQELTRKIMTHDKSSRGSVLIGKTGSGYRDENYDIRLGWFVGHLEKNQTEYIVIVNFNDTQKEPGRTYGGREAKEIALKLLSEKKLW